MIVPNSSGKVKGYRQFTSSPLTSFRFGAEKVSNRPVAALIRRCRHGGRITRPATDPLHPEFPENVVEIGEQ